MSDPATPTPNNFPALATGVKQWGFAHWTYILVAIGFNLIGVFLHI